MLNTIINLIRFLFRPKNGMGVHLDEPDYRDIPVGAFTPTVATPPYSEGIYEALRWLPHFDQKQTGSCVPHAIAELLMAYIYRKTGKIVKISPRMAYAICKLIDGLDSPGTYPRVGAKVFTKWGCATEDLVPNDTGLPEGDYQTVLFTLDVLNSAKDNKLPGYAYVEEDIEEIKQAIHLFGCVTGTTQVGSWDRLPLKADKFNGLHYTLWYAYETLLNGDVKIYIRNSWSNKWLNWLPQWLRPGDGYFLWSEYKDKVSGIIAFTDIPADYLNKVKSMPYRFTQEMGIGVKHPQVKELQKLLNEDPTTLVSAEGAGSPGEETDTFGPATKKALIKWQEKNRITPVTGYFGPKSMAKANEGIGNISRIIAWANAIKKHEGYFPGSRSYKNNNPGNIRYTGLFRAMAIGKDDKNFCVFETYDKGFEALKTLLIRACTGLSSVYKPNMTLTEFYGVYAPDADNNDSNAYARAVAKELGVPPTTKIKELL